MILGRYAYIYFPMLRPCCIYKYDANRCVHTSYAGWARKVTPNNLYIYSSNTGRFSQFFHCYNLNIICNAAVIKPHLKRVATHYRASDSAYRETICARYKFCMYVRMYVNIYARKLACPVQCGSLAAKCKDPQNPDVRLAEAAILNKMH